MLTAALLAIAPARHAIADWLGIGAVEVRHSEGTVLPANGAHTVPGAPSTGTAAPGPVVARHLDGHAPGQFRDRDAARRVGGRARWASNSTAGSPTVSSCSVTPDSRWSRSRAGAQRADLLKLLGALPVETVTVDGRTGTLGLRRTPGRLLGRAGQSGPTPCAARDRCCCGSAAGVTYRIEGLDRRADTLAIAASALNRTPCPSPGTERARAVYPGHDTIVHWSRSLLVVTLAAASEPVRFGRARADARR